MPCKGSGRACLDCIWKPGEHQIWKSESTSEFVECAAKQVRGNPERWLAHQTPKWSFHVPGFAEFQGIASVKNFRLPVGLQELCKLLWVSYRFFVFHGYAWIHWVAESCTTTAYRWLFRDSHPSLRTLRFAVIKSPKFSALCTPPPLRLLHGAFVILVLWQISQFRFSGKWA